MPLERLLSCTLLVVAACGRDSTPEARGPNRPPLFPDSLRIESGSVIERDGRQNVTGAVTTVRISGVTDPDGDSLTYRWEGSRFNGDTLVPVALDAVGPTARFRTGVILDEAAGGLLRLTVTDPSGASAVKEICISGGGFSC